jgi:hypothetical protein
VEPNSPAIQGLIELGLVRQGDEVVELYHATSEVAANLIRESSALAGDPVYLSTSEEILGLQRSQRDEVDTLVRVTIALERINDEIDGDWREHGYLHLTASPALGEESIPVVVIDLTST